MQASISLQDRRVQRWPRIDFFRFLHHRMTLTEPGVEFCPSISTTCAVPRANFGMSDTADARMAPWERSMAGLAGGACSAVLLHPLDVLKTRRQAALTRGEASMANALVTMARREGRRGLYAGLSPSLLGASIAWSAYMTLFDLLRNAWSPQRTAEKDLVCAYAAGACVAVLTNPIWLVKTRMQLGQTRGKGVWRAMRDIQKQEGWKACWRGSAPAVAMAAHGALQLSAYEGIKRTWIGHEDKDVGAMNAGVMAAASKILASSATYPIQVVRTHMQKDGGLSIRLAVKTTWEKGGRRGFYAGWVPHVARVVPSAAITFVVYEATLTLLRKMHLGDA